MAKYGVRIKEQLARTVIIEAESLSEALEYAEKLHSNGNIYLGFDDYDGVEVKPAWGDGIIKEDIDETLYENYIV